MAGEIGGLMNNSDRALGVVLGLALGDAYGAPFEGRPLERVLWKIIGNTNGKKRWTDDTQMTIDVIESLLECGLIHQDNLAKRFAESYRWSRGYGPGAAKILQRIKKGEPWKKANISVFSEGSFGNGGAMRAPVIGLYYSKYSDIEIVNAAKQCAEITHAHQLGLEGAGIIALATALSIRNIKSSELIERLSLFIESDELAVRI